MNKLAITTFATTFALAAGLAASVSASGTTTVTTTSTTTTTANATPAQSVANAAPAAGKHHHHHLHHQQAATVAPVDKPDGYTEMRIGDPRIVYHEIGTSGAQKGNTIVPFYDEPIRSSKPYEIRYDYAEFKA